MNHDPVILILAGLAGAGLGIIFFGGLWWTVRRILAARNPALWVLGSALLRTGTVVAGFYAVAGADWARLLAALAGFLVMRQIVLRLTDGARHAP